MLNTKYRGIFFQKTNFGNRYSTKTKPGNNVTYRRLKIR